MRPHRPARRERLLATATFAGIALATVLALDFIVTGGFEIAAPRSHPTYYAPLMAFSAPLPAEGVVGQSPGGDVNAVGWSDPLVIDAAPIQTTDTQPPPLAGDTHADEGSLSYVDPPSDDALYREIESLYAEQDKSAAERAQAAAGDENEQPEAAEHADAPTRDPDLNPDFSQNTPDGG